MQRLIAITVLASAITWLSAIAQDAPNRRDNDKDAVLQSTMDLIPANAQTPAAVTATIELPRNESGAYVPSAQGVAHSAHGLDTANLAREDGRAFGEAMAAKARDNRENVSRASRDAASAERPPTPPETPDPPRPAR